MTNENRTENEKPTRRESLARSAGFTAGLVGGLGLAQSARGGAGDELKIALVGCGGRGTGAAIDALSTRGPIRLVAMGDVFPDRLSSSRDRLKAHKNVGARIEVPEDRRFVGFDAYQNVATYSGAEVTWEQAINSKLDLARPGCVLAVQRRAGPRGREGRIPYRRPRHDQGVVNRPTTEKRWRSTRVTRGSGSMPR